MGMIPLPEQLDHAPKWKQNLFKFGLVMGTGYVVYNLIEWAVGM